MDAPVSLGNGRIWEGVLAPSLVSIIGTGFVLMMGTQFVPIMGSARDERLNDSTGDAARYNDRLAADALGAPLSPSAALMR
jgi:hypothetical protein